ncbi:hypothetical protein [Demequina activiva]|uniref:Uncharacterized protein n=1 Tax=Demequina activiva TaxID=1582364 RepID=A0A919Q1A1_9MICO|nr:hypothetical protein [Demequina activiva]GIG54337.1 hypothetical protein Dac01nite_10890 [Demequina activiva]
MTDVSADDTRATTTKPRRLITLRELEHRLDRLERLQELDRRAAAAACPHGGAPHDRTAPGPGTTVIFSDEVCDECGAQSAQPAQPAQPA